jgi:endonuclease YncB( thermonuclease family)
MEMVVKKYLKNFPFQSIAVVFLISLNVSAETVTDSEDSAVSETVTVTVTRTGEGIEVVTPNGRHVLLKNDHTWQYIELEQLPAEESAVLDVVNVKELSNACDIGFRLTNNLPYKIKSLVPSFSAYTRDQVLFDTQSKSFNSIKPTRSQYQKVRFIGIICPEISHVKLLGADRCTMGPFTKFDSGEGECLKRIHIRDNDLIKVLK